VYKNEEKVKNQSNVGKNIILSLDSFGTYLNLFQINKLGDPVRSVAAKATYQIGLLLEKHPAMKAVVLDEIERLLYRPNIAAKAQYYGICCLTQVNAKLQSYCDYSEYSKQLKTITLL